MTEPLAPPSSTETWPALPLAEWEPTRATLHMWTQIVGKVRTELSAPVNHWWHSTLYVTPRGLTTSIIPFGPDSFDVEFDFLDHKVVVRTSRGQTKSVGMYPRSVADFYREFMATLKSLGIEVKIWTQPQEVPDAIHFDQDEQHASYDGEYVRRLHRILMSCDEVFKQFRGRFLGKCSPVHFFWGGFDLAVTRFSGRRAPERPDADPVTREGYSHEVISLGWWAGSGDVKDPAFYAYAAPEPPGFTTARVRPAAVTYHTGLKLYLLMYDDVRKSSDPRRSILSLAQTTYEAGSTMGGWPMDLERLG